MNDVPVELLHKKHDLDSFTCGVESLDSWLHKSAWPTHGAGENRTYVWCEKGAVLGYFTLAPAIVVTNPMIHATMPAILLCKLAVHEDRRGQGEPLTHGERLLLTAFQVVLQAADLIGGRFLAVDPINAKVAAYYERYGFEPLDEGEDRRVIKLSTLRRAHGATPLLANAK